VPELAALLGRLALMPKRAAGRPKLLAAALEALDAEPALPDRQKVPCMSLLVHDPIDGMPDKRDACHPAKEAGRQGG
jgi:hypothetical protein